MTENVNPRRPNVSGLSPKEGAPGTQLIIRGENLGQNANDLLAVFICGTDCTMSARWESSHKVVARVGQAKAGVGPVLLMTRAGGKGICSVTFKVYHVQIGPLQESAVWVDESRSVPGRESNETSSAVDDADLLAINKTGKAVPHATLASLFPEGSGNLKLDNFVPAWYLLENCPNATLAELRSGLQRLSAKNEEKREQQPVDVVRLSLHSYVACVDALDKLRLSLGDHSTRHGWPLTKELTKHVEDSHKMADDLFSTVLQRKEKADATRNALSVISKIHRLLFLPHTIEKNLQKGEYGTILSEYASVKSIYGGSDMQLFKDCFVEIDKAMQKFKHLLKDRLVEVPSTLAEQKNIIRYLLVLEPQSDPGIDCIGAHHFWLEGQLWAAQQKFYAKTRDRQSDQETSDSDRDDRTPGSELSAERFEFVECVIGILSSKTAPLNGLMAAYMDGTLSQRTNLHRESELQAMLTNTTNLASWLMLNALLPDTVPHEVLAKYRDRFAQWPTRGSLTHMQLGHLLHALRKLRHCVHVMKEQELAAVHLQPLIELSVTLRMKCLVWVTESTSNSIVALEEKENWKLQTHDSEATKTHIPDMFEALVCDMLPVLRQLLSTDAFADEPTIYERSKLKQRIDTSIQSVLTAPLNLLRSLVRLRSNADANMSDTDGTPGTHGLQRPNTLTLDQQPAVKDKKLLISCANCKYMNERCLEGLMTRLAASGMPDTHIMLHTVQKEYQDLSDILLQAYINAKCPPLYSMIDACPDIYQSLSQITGVSNNMKDCVLFVVSVQAELLLYAPVLAIAVLDNVLLKSAERLRAMLQLLQAKHTPRDKHIDMIKFAQAMLDYTAFTEAMNMHWIGTKACTQREHKLCEQRFLDLCTLPPDSATDHKQNLAMFHRDMRLALLSLSANKMGNNLYNTDGEAV